jgi:hypothetical protein
VNKGLSIVRFAKTNWFWSEKCAPFWAKKPLFDLLRGYFKPSAYYLRRLKLPWPRLGRVLEGGSSTDGLRSAGLPGRANDEEKNKKGTFLMR